MHAINWGIQVNRRHSARGDTHENTKKKPVSSGSDFSLGARGNAAPDQKVMPRTLQLFEHKLQQHATTSNYSNWECGDRRSWLRASPPKVRYIHLRAPDSHIYLFTLLRLWFWRDRESPDNRLSWNECKNEGDAPYRRPLAWVRNTDAARFVYVQPNTTLRASPRVTRRRRSLSTNKAERKDCVCANIKEEEEEGEGNPQGSLNASSPLPLRNASSPRAVLSWVATLCPPLASIA